MDRAKSGLHLHSFIYVFFSLGDRQLTLTASEELTRRYQQLIQVNVYPL